MLPSLPEEHPSYLLLVTVVSPEIMEKPVPNSSIFSLQVAPCELDLYFSARILILALSVTSVGATNGIFPETAADFSGGGFSNYFPRPSYQDAQVNAFLSGLNDTYAGLYNATGRAYPDVAAQGVNFEISWLWYPEYATGTSCATPTVASIVSLINDRLIAAGKPVLGFLNPWLYSNASSAFTDIVSGNAAGCGTNGWSAVEGWDPVCRSYMAMMINVSDGLFTDLRSWNTGLFRASEGGRSLIRARSVKL